MPPWTTAAPRTGRDTHAGDVERATRVTSRIWQTLEELAEEPFTFS